MTLRNPNRFVTGLSDIYYVKNVAKVEVSYNDTKIPVVRNTIQETVSKNMHEVDTDKMVLNPTNNPGNAQ